MNIVTEHKEDERGFLVFHQTMEGRCPNNRSRKYLTAIFRTKKINISYHMYMNLIEDHYRL